MQRGKKTIEVIRKADSKINLEDLRVESLIKKNPHVSDPTALSFLAEQLIKMGKMSIKTESHALINLLEVFLSFTVLFGSDEKSKTREIMLQTCVNIIKM